MRSVEECKIVVVIIIIIYLYKISKASVNIFYSVNKDYKLKKIVGKLISAVQHVRKFVKGPVAAPEISSCRSTTGGQGTIISNRARLTVTQRRR